MPKARITVVKKVAYNELFGGNPPALMNNIGPVPECSRLEVGQEFIVDTDRDSADSPNWEMPAGFCPWAFADMQRDISHILHGGSYPWMREKGVAVACCTDGLRPVIFKIEKIAD